jgi:lipid II:glycine glycyltransferase (peptidoglycan interpeptide bridge formation enzyme)
MNKKQRQTIRKIYEHAVEIEKLQHTFDDFRNSKDLATAIRIMAHDLVWEDDDCQ